MSNDAPILGFWNEYRFLSNFWPAEVELDGVVYPSVEHAYQAAKTLVLKDREFFAQPTLPPGTAKRQGKWIREPRKDWDQVKRSIMTQLVRQKFAHPELMATLKATGSRYLEETNSWGDRYWGVHLGIGHNYLGQILMEIRDFSDTLEY